MRVRFRASGGFAWTRPRSCDCDTQELGAAEARELRELVTAAGIEGLEERLSPDARDVERFEITVIDGDRIGRLTIDGASVGPELAPLLEFLIARARREADPISGRSA